MSSFIKITFNNLSPLGRFIYGGILKHHKLSWIEFKNIRKDRNTYENLMLDIINRIN